MTTWAATVKPGSSPRRNFPYQTRPLAATAVHALRFTFTTDPRELERARTPGSSAGAAGYPAEWSGSRVGVGDDLVSLGMDLRAASQAFDRIEPGEAGI